MKFLPRLKKSHMTLALLIGVLCFGVFFSGVAFAQDTKSSSYVETRKAQGVTPSFEAQGDVIAQYPSPASVMGIHYVPAHNVLYVVSEDGTGNIYKMDESGNVLGTLPGPSTSMNGITFDGQYLWVTDYYGQDAASDWLYQLDPNTGAVINAWDLMPQGTNGILGIAWDGQNLWVSSVGNSTIYQLDTNGTVVGSFPVSWINSGLDWDGQYLISTDDAGGILHRIDRNGNEVDSMPAPGGGAAFGVTCGGTPGQLWHSNYVTLTLYLVECSWCGDGEQPDISVSPGSFDVDVPQGTSTTRDLIIRNDGGATLNVSRICDDEGGPVAFKSASDASALKGSPSSSYSETRKAQGVTPSFEAQGDVIAQYPSPASVMGIHYVPAHNVLYVVSEDGTGNIYKMDESGNVLGTLPGPSTSMNGITFDGQYLWVTDYYGQDAASDWLYQLDPNTGAVINAWDLMPQGTNGILGIAWDGQNLWVSSVGNSTIYQLDTNGTVVGSFPVSWINSGLDWDGQYLISTDDAGGILHRIDRNGNEVDSMPAPGGGAAFGVTCGGTPGQLWHSNYVTLTLYLVECSWCGNGDEICTNDAPWLTQNPNANIVIPPGGQETITVTFNASGLPLGTYFAVIHIQSNDPDEGVVNIPVTMRHGDGPPCEEDDSGSLDIEGKSGGPGATVIVPVRIQNAPDQVASFGFEMTYNTAILQYVGNSRGECVTDFDQFGVHEREPGLLVIGGFEAGDAVIPAGANCVVVNLEFTVVGGEPGEVYPLGNLQNLVDDIAGWSNSGACFKCGGCDVNGDGDVTPQDALCAFQKYLGIDPTDCGPADQIFCDVNGDGQCTPADALEIFKCYLGMETVCSPQECE